MFQPASRTSRELKQLGFIAKIFILYAVLGIGCFLMLRTIIGYASLRTDVQFLAVKQAYIHDPVWLASFYIHVFSAVVALCAGFTQFSKQFQIEHRAAHRLMGRIYVVDILAVNVPAGMIMAIDANGGWIGKTAFVLLDCLWFLFTCRAYSEARRKHFASHKNFMLRSFALTFSAITLRSWKLVLSHSFTIDTDTLYLIDAWMGFVPNMLVAECLVRFNKNGRIF